MVTIRAVVASVPERAPQARALIASLKAEGFTVDQIEDRENRGVWPTVREAWLTGAASGTSHTMVIQDDVLLCRNFGEHVIKAAEARPNDLISLFSMSGEIKTAYIARYTWAVSPTVSWGQGTILNRSLALEFVKWCDLNVRPDYRWDDGRLALWCLNTGRQAYLTVPSLLQHVDGPSTVGNPQRIGGKRRQASTFGFAPPKNFMDLKACKLKGHRIGEYKNWEVTCTTI